MDELNPTVREQEIYEEMELTPEMVKSIRTLCGTCLRHFVDLGMKKHSFLPDCSRMKRVVIWLLGFHPFPHRS